METKEVQPLNVIIGQEMRAVRTEKGWCLTAVQPFAGIAENILIRN